MNLRLRTTLSVFLSAGMVCAAAWSVCLAYADTLARSDSPAQLQRAIRLVPGNASWWLRWSELADADAVTVAADVNPYNASLWIRAGLRAEAAGNRAGAEQSLLRAAAASRKYEPRWTLANFYFRGNDPEHFWQWMKTALEWAPGDRSPLFKLCWQMSQDAEIVLARGIPNSPQVLGEYLLFLLHTARLDAVEPVAARLMPLAAPEQRRALMNYTSRMLETRRWQAALNAWNALCARRILPYPALDTARGSVVTNGGFQAEPLGTGFDWRPVPVQGISCGRTPNPAAWRVAFSGAQPESAEPLSQIVPVAPGARYRLGCIYDTEGLPSQSGIRWRILDLDTGAEIAALELHEAVAGSLTFSVPPNVSMLRLVLACRRPADGSRMEGTLRLRHVTLEPAP